MTPRCSAKRRRPRPSSPRSNSTATWPSRSIRWARHRRAPPSCSPSSMASPKPTSSKSPDRRLDDPDAATAADVVRKMQSAYCGSIAYEFAHLGDENEREWFRRMIESGEATAPLADDEKKMLFERLTEVDGLERFLGRAYVGREALLDRGHRRARADARRGDRTRRAGRHDAGRDRDGAPRPPQRAHARHGQAVPLTLRRVRGRASPTRYRQRRREVPPGLSRRTRVSKAGAIDVELVPNPSHLEFVNPVPPASRAHGSA